MLFKLMKPKNNDFINPLKWVVEIYRDESTPSCGESRSDWTRVGTVSLGSLLKAVYRFATGQSVREYV